VIWREFSVIAAPVVCDVFLHCVANWDLLWPNATISQNASSSLPEFIEEDQALTISGVSLALYELGET
jgi:hypothetical protein